MAKFALLIGVGNYDYPNAVRPLSSAHQDVAALQRVLLDPELGSFSEAITLLDPDPYQMQTAIETLFRDRQKEDLLLLYYLATASKTMEGTYISPPA
jgi:branched-chain amino acid transport system substrate-binding protein